LLRLALIESKAQEKIQKRVSMKQSTALPSAAFVEETRFGNWFLRTPTWKRSVLNRALTDLQRMLPADKTYPLILDTGCGFGISFAELARCFSPERIVAIDPAPGLEERAGEAATACPCPVDLRTDNAAQMDFPDSHFDMVFCHQTYHHIVAQEEAMAEFFRVLKPGGVLLFAESTKKYIHSLPIRLLFRHPMHVQRTAPEYMDMVRQAGFELPDANISTPYLWWSRPDIGFLEWIGRPVPTQREETMVNAVAYKPMR
jgi:ubiquinone/menaquinone biosynthesis C-methylase UbiE